MVGLCRHLCFGTCMFVSRFFSSKHARCCFFFVRMVVFAQRRSNVSSQIAMSVSPSNFDGVGLLPPQCGQPPLQVDVEAGQLAPPASGGHATATATYDSASCNDLPSQIAPHVIVSSETFASLLAILATSNVSSNDNGVTKSSHASSNASANASSEFNFQRQLQSNPPSVLFLWSSTPRGRVASRVHSV